MAYVFFYIYTILKALFDFNLTRAEKARESQFIFQGV